jgi:hypothetical protein
MQGSLLDRRRSASIHEYCFQMELLSKSENRIEEIDSHPRHLTMLQYEDPHRLAGRNAVCCEPAAPHINFES